ncbi:MAG TPA: TrmH family RNA methyltransferase [Actinomycetota bacterium]|nr:TrmH family RNA methyltransferase [Actinomycetota bacterium]
MISSTKNPKVVAAARLHKRARREVDRRFLVEGAQGVREALAESPSILQTLFVEDDLHELAVAARAAGVDVVPATDSVLARITSTVTPQGVVGVAPFVDVALDALPRSGCVSILHEVRDPGNAGTVLRSADAAGVSGVVFTSSSVDVYNAKTIRASAGSVFHVPVVRGVSTSDTIGHLRAGGFRILAMDARGSESLYASALDGPIAFVFGNEAHGLPADVVRLSDATVRVPHVGRAESLNLAAAASICLFEWARRHVDAGASLESMITAAAHDIRSPLTAMKGFGYALEKRWNDMTDDTRALMLAGIVHDADRMDQILRLLVDAARVSGGSLEGYRDRTDVSEVVDALVDMQARDPEHPDITWAGDPGPFFIDPTRLKTALLAFDEALVWWASTGPIAIAATREGDDVHVVASRHGATVDVDEAEALFVPRRAGAGGGSKIGLYVVRVVAEAQGGRVWPTVEDDRLALHLSLPVVP